MSDRELLELAAKAAGMNCGKAQDAMFFYCEHGQRSEGMYRIHGNLLEFWNPLTDDGDALRLAVKLGLEITVDFDRVDVIGPGGLIATEYRYEVPTPTDPYAATRRAIVRAAAEIGRAMP